MEKDNTKKEIVQITPDNIKELNIGVGSVIKDDRGDYWKITKADDFYADMHICDKDGNKIENFVGNAVRSAFGGGLTGLLNDGVTICYIETESPEITKNPLSHVKFYVTEFAEFPTYNDTENMSLPEAVSFMRQANSTKDNESKFGTPVCFTIGLEIDGERFGNDGSSYNPLTGEFDTLMYEANSLFRKYGGHALNSIAEEIEKQNKELPENKKMPCNFNRADFGLEEKNESHVSPSEIGKNKIEIKPVTLEEILDVMEFNLEPQKNGTFKIFDRQLGEYKDNRSHLPDTDENNWTFTNATEIFERLDIYINDYFIHDMEECLEEGGVTLRGDETLEDLCACAKQQLEAGITTVSEGELNLAMGIVHPETVIMPESLISQEQISNHLKKTDEKTNYILEKLAKAGIEVVTDKDEFEKILKNEEILQKMAKESLVEELFETTNNEELNPQIDALTINDVNLKDDYINISEKTPFIFKECGLDDFPVNMYKQKLARAFFLEEQKFGERLTHGHKGEFSSNIVKEVFKNLGNPRYVFNSKLDTTNPDNFYLIGVYDQLDEQKNPMVVSLHFNKNRKEIEANWITSIYGKRKKILVNDWTRKGYLVYMNDLDIEKAPAEVVTLQMRVSKSASAYLNRIKKKSDFVNDLEIAFFAQNNQIYGFAHNGKIYLNPDIMNSEVAVHEYTHLWDTYIQKTNPELWNKGLEVFKNTSLWNDVINDENYSDIKNNENLVLSECHARLCGKIANEVLQKVLERDGDLKKSDMINWDNETWEYIGIEFRTAAIKVLEAETKEFSFNNTKEFLEQFLSSPMKDLFQKELNMKLEKTYEQKYPSYIKNRFVLEQNHPDGWAVGKKMWVVWDNLLNQRGRSGGFFDTEKGIEAGNKELNEIIDSVNKSETEALEKEYEGNGVYTCQLFSDYSGYGSTTTRHDMLFVSAKNNKSGTGIDVAGVRDSDSGTIRSYVKDYAKRNNILSDGIIVSFNPVDKRKEANKLWTDFSMLAKETDTSFVYQDGDKESRYAFAIDYAQKHNLPCFLIDNEISRKVANDVDFVVFCKDYEDIITKVKSLSEENSKLVEFNGKPKVLEGVTASELLNDRPIKTEELSENQDDKKQTNSIELTSDDLKNAKALLPKEQYQLVLSYTQGEESEHFKGIIKEISSKAENIKGKGEILTEDEKHPLAFKYTLGNSSFYFSEWDGDDELFGYVVLNEDTQNSEWGYTSLSELKNTGGLDRNGFPVMPEMTFYGLEETIEKQISIDYPELSEKMGFSHKKNHNEELISEFGKEILETLDNRKLEHSAYNICCAAQFVLRSMDSSERKEVFSMMEKCGCQGKYIKENTEDFLTKCVLAENKTANSEYTRKQLYERINKACSTKKTEANKGIQDPESDYDIEI